MPDRSPELDAAVRAVRGESDLDAVLPALDDWRLARVIACAPEAHHLVGAVAALHSGLPSALDPPTVADPDLHDALAHLIGTRAGRHALSGWAHVAPAGWGRAHAEALIDAVHANMCAAIAAAALIGPCDASAALLHDPYDASSAIRCWGPSDPAAPTAWAEALSPAERDRLLTIVHHDPFRIAFCLPWLPPNAMRAADADVPVGAALDAFVVASPTARAQHAAILQTLVARALPMHLDDLTRLACAMGSDDVWRRVQTLIRESPDDACLVVAAAPWDDLPEDVRAAILERADPSDVCAAVAAARGKRMSDSISWKTAAAFFAALDPAVWDALDAATQQRWRNALWRDDVHLAVRSLGLRPEILARAEIDPPLVHAVRRHACDVPPRRAALLPVALHACDPAAAHAVIAAMPTLPPDPGAFFGIASGRDDPDLIAPAGAALRSPADLALAIVLQRSGEGGASIRACCAALQHALRGRTWDDLAPILPLLTDAARTACMPRTAIFARRLARPDQRDALRRTLDRLAALPPAVAIPTHVALHRRTRRRTDASDAAEAIADALRVHGGVFLALADAQANEHLRQALLPLPKDAALADALRALAHDDLPTARRLAQALRDGDWKNVIRLAPSLPQWARNAIPPHADDLVARLARPDGRDQMRAALQQLASAAPDADVPARCALDRLATKNADVWDAAKVLAHAMRHVGDAFLSIMDALADDGLRQALLPLPEDAALADALRALVRDNPVGGRTLACALHDRDRRQALRALLMAEPHHAAAVWQALDDATRRAIGAEVAAASPDADPLAVHDPIAALALAAVHADDADLRAAGITALAARPDVLRARWGALPTEMQHILRSHLAVADMTAASAGTADMRQRRRYGLR